MKKVPTGVTVIGVLYIALSALAIIGSIMGFLMYYFLPEVMAESMSLTGMPMNYYMYSLVQGAILAVILIFLAFNLLKLKEWARKWFIILIGINFAIGVISLIALYYMGVEMLWMSTIGLAVGAVFYALIIWYLSKPEIKKAFS